MCSFLEAPLNGTINSTDVAYDTHVEVRCDDGFTFTPDNRSVTLRCEEFGLWSASTDDCQGLKNLVLRIFCCSAVDLLIL